MQSKEESIQIELKYLKNLIARHSKRILNVKNFINDFKDKIRAINKNKAAREKKEKRKEYI